MKIKLTEFQRSLFEYFRGVLGAIHLAGVTMTGSFTWGL